MKGALRSLPVLCLLLASASVCPADRRDIASLSIECLLSVTVKAASLHRQKPAEAPASVTVITREDIWKYGYKTLSDAPPPRRDRKPTAPSGPSPPL